MAAVFACARVLADSGYEVSWCPGPAGPPERRCPLLEFGQCEVAERADVVVSSLDLRHDCSRRVVAAFRHHHPETPMVIRTTEEALAQWSPVFEGRWGGVRMPATQHSLLDSVAAATTQSPLVLLAEPSAPETHW
ncbi:MAG TPA: hypothetical protein VMV22_13550 [Acidimicrobiales bacterium]|nr:hypothetical protein [Acidimicrobiales bacterium]